MSHSARRKAAQPRSARLIPSSLGSALCSPSRMIEAKTAPVTTSWTPPAAQWSSRSSSSSSMRTLRLVLASSCVLTRRRTAGRKFSRSLRLMSSADSTEEPPFEVECPKERRKLAEPATAFTWRFATADATSDRVELPVQDVPRRRAKGGEMDRGSDLSPRSSSETSFSSAP
eukprot:scaffold37890_cov27-Phaeocystis_antarctica.AAC.2